MTDSFGLPQNPYVVGRPVPPLKFIGRTSEIETAFDQIFSRSNLALWGGPGIGKSSFLELLASPHAWTLRSHDPSKAVIVMLSCLSIQPFTATHFWREVFILLKEQLDDEPDIQAEATKYLDAETTSKDCLRSILREIGKRDRFLLLLVDDYDAALRPNQSYGDQDIMVFLSECRNLASHSRERQFLSMVVTSLRRLNELGPKLKPDGSPWYNHYLFQPLKPFTNTEIAGLLGGLPMTPALRDGIHEVADGNPALLQNAGFLLYRELRAGHVPDADAFAKDFRQMTEHYFQDIWDLSNDTEQTLLMLLGLVNLKGRILDKRYDLGDVDIIFSQKERELMDLEERGVIVCQGDDGQKVYQFASSLMEWWVVKEIANRDEASLQARQKLFLNLMSHRQAENVTTAIRWLWDNREAVPSILAWLGKLSAALPRGFVQG
ncbi:ATP-binding protein [Myxacorys almedinensis]|uniref:AAA family ATPase n=1 Tax=Myxacorys almedinensis A TaxID=2690445 RepID=A0A8J7YWL8_9CYAN|nr:ATP-binding protein [Myxacorys almedinensis]NDJ15959.1 AAA family ATPase [Myxacorys almedinensis A]